MAIAFDSASGGGNSFTHVTAGVDRTLVVTYQSADSVLGVATYGGIQQTGSITTVVSSVSGLKTMKSYYWINPALGSNTVSVAGGTTPQGVSVSYTGTRQTTIGNINTSIFAVSSMAAIASVLNAQSWVVWAVGSNAAVTGTVSASPGGNSKGAVGYSGYEVDIGDSGGSVASGLVTETITVPNSGGTPFYTHLFSLAPSGTSQSSLVGAVGAFTIHGQDVALTLNRYTPWTNVAKPTNSVWTNIPKPT